MVIYYSSLRGPRHTLLFECVSFRQAYAVFFTSPALVTFISFLFPHILLYKFVNMIISNKLSSRILITNFVRSVVFFPHVYINVYEVFQKNGIISHMLYWMCIPFLINNWNYSPINWYNSKSFFSKVHILFLCNIFSVTLSSIALLFVWFFITTMQ